MSRISKLAAFMITTIGVALVGTGTAVARPDQAGLHAPAAQVPPSANVTEQVTTNAASPLWQFVVVALAAAAVTAIVLVVVARLAQRDRPRRTGLVSA
jgi:hypothetical protein